MKRRSFIKKSSAALTGSLILPQLLYPFSGEKMIGIQLYTIRDKVQNDLEGTLQLLSEIGYQSIEAAGYNNRKFYGLPPKEFKKRVEQAGLKPLSTHSNITLSTAGETIEDTLEAGMKFLFVPSMPQAYRQSPDQYKKAAEEFNIIGEKCHAAGLKFGYHNHAFEFEPMEGQIPYDILLQATDPRYVNMQLDLYWMVYAGYSPVDYFANYPGRFISWHVKDMEQNEKKDSTEIGSGSIDFQEIFRHKRQAGLECYFVEQEAFKMDQIESITQSCQYLKKLKDA